MTNSQEQERGLWRPNIDNYSEHYEVTNSSRERAEVGDGYLFRMGDKDSMEAVLVYLNDLERRVVVLADSVREVVETALQQAVLWERRVRALQAQLKAVGAKADLLPEFVTALITLRQWINSNAPFLRVHGYKVTLEEEAIGFEHSDLLARYDALNHQQEVGSSDG